MFEDREDAAKQLAIKIKKVLKDNSFVAVALVRGGVVLGKVIADYFQIPLYPLVIRKVGAPNNPELAIGAIGPKNTVYWDKKSLRYFNIDDNYKSEIIREKTKEIENLERILKSSLRKNNLSDKIAIVVDDGVATGASVMCAAKFLKSEKSKEIILATPIIAKDILSHINKYFDRVIYLKTVKDFGAVGEFYKYFPQISNEEVLKVI